MLLAVRCFGGGILWKLKEAATGGKEQDYKGTEKGKRRELLGTQEGKKAPRPNLERGYLNGH